MTWVSISVDRGLITELASHDDWELEYTHKGRREVSETKLQLMLVFLLCLTSVESYSAVTRCVLAPLEWAWPT